MSRAVKKMALGFVCALASVAVGFGAGAASALPSTGYASWTIAPGPGGFTGSVTLPTGFPAVTFTTDSRAPTQIFSGASAYLSASSAFGVPFGSSANQPYLSIRPRADAPGNPSTTVFTFANPTPVGGWGYVAGDIDAETVTIAATDTAGNPVPAASLGVTAFNYCVDNLKCSSTIVPTLANSVDLVTAQDPNCTPTCDTDGESIWVNPTVALRSLTVTSEGKQGAAAFQNWFATIGRTVSGTATTTCTSTPSVELLDGSGAVIATSPVTAGTFSFPLVAARSDYTVREVAAGATSNPPVAADVSAADASALAVTADCAAAAVVADPPQLAATGANPGPAPLIALALVALGITLRVRRRSAPRHA